MRGPDSTCWWRAGLALLTVGDGTLLRTGLGFLFGFLRGMSGLTVRALVVSAVPSPVPRWARGFLGSGFAAREDSLYLLGDFDAAEVCAELRPGDLRSGVPSRRAGFFTCFCTLSSIVFGVEIGHERSVGRFRRTSTLRTQEARIGIQALADVVDHVHAGQKRREFG